MDIRIGQGFDVHRLESNRPLILGGVTIPFDRGLSGHSDADIVLHSLTDAVLGALSWGDIGEWFPPTDPQYAGADSMKLLGKVWSKAKSEGWSLVNCDITVLAERPRLRPFMPEMQKRIAEALSVSAEQVGIKATTTEKLGFVGREEGMAASAVVLLRKG